MAQQKKSGKRYRERNTEEKMDNGGDRKKKGQKIRKNRQILGFGAAGLVCLVLIVVIARGLLALRAEKQEAARQQSSTQTRQEQEAGNGQMRRRRKISLWIRCCGGKYGRQRSGDDLGSRGLYAGDG